MHQFFMHAQLLTHRAGRKQRVVRDQAHCTGIRALTNAPDMQISDARLALNGKRRNDLANLGDHGVIHLAIQQDGRRLRQQPFAHLATSRAPTMPIRGSSHAQPRNQPPSSAMSASTEVAASAST